MPYIKQEDRDKIMIRSDYGTGIRISKIDTAGELQYAMAEMFKSYMERKGLSYQNCNDVMGALAGAQMEYYRRTVTPYEEEKIKENGDV